MPIRNAAMLSAIVEMPHGEEDRIEVREELKQWGF